MKYDYLVVGAGLFGAVFTYEAKKRGKSVLVIDRRDHIAGNVYTENVHGINVHRYGAHIFHTSNKEVWDYVNQFAEFNNYINSPIAIYKDELYNLPFNMNTFSKLWGIRTPAEAQAKIKEGSEANIEILDLTLEMMELASNPDTMDEAQEKMTELTEKMNSYSDQASKLTEGLTEVLGS